MRSSSFSKFKLFVLTLLLGIGIGSQSHATPVKWTKPAQAPNAVRGKKVYFKYCVFCHGRFGKGDGPSGKALPQNPANFTDKAFMTVEPDPEFYKVISEGGGSVGITPFMPSFGHTLKNQEIHDVLSYIRTYCKCAYDPKKAKEHAEHEKKEHGK